jgi:ArsR family transcriptional regulator, arsenate/arsenite/antimonite-responsive transcriptional repressor
MEMNRAALALSALAHETRLAVFRLLVREGPGGLPAGEVAARLQVTPATLSFHLGQLERAGLLSSNRRSRQIIYRVDLGGTRRLLAFLTEDCCQGRPDLCAGLESGFASKPAAGLGDVSAMREPPDDYGCGPGNAPGRTR